MEMTNLKTTTCTAMGIALFVALSYCLRVPVFENYYVCLGYTVMTVFCYSIGTISGTLVGTIGVFLYCLLISGLRGMPGWAVGNIFLGLIMGVTFTMLKKLKKPKLEFFISSVIVIVATAFAILIVKSCVEYVIYGEAFVLRFAKNIYAFISDAIVIIFSIPLSQKLDPEIRKILG